MSATGRTDARRDSDHYVTPPWSVERLLEVYQLPEGATVLDPCAANGELLATIKKLRPDLVLVAIEIRPECTGPLQALVDAGVISGFIIGDLLALPPDAALDAGCVDYVITNPPYSLAKEIIDECNRIARVANIQLLRINFLGAQERRDWTAETKPGALVLPNRPSYTGWGGDATEYAWLVYKDETWSGRWAVLALTDAKVIKEWNAAARALFPEMNPKLRRAAKDAVEALAEAVA